MSQNQEKTSLNSLVDQTSEDFKHEKFKIDCSGLSGSERAYLVSRLYVKHKIPIIVIVSSAKEGDNFLKDLRFFLSEPAPPVIYFPPYNILPFKFFSCHNETSANRISVLYQLTSSSLPPVVVTTIEALQKKIIPKKELLNYVELIMTGEEISRELLLEKLISGGYARSAIVEEPGDFCIRGGILDVFSPLYQEPLRIEFFGDTIDSIRFFSAVSQRKIKDVHEAVILPAREVILKKERLDQIITRIRRRASELGTPVTIIRELVDRIKKEDLFQGIESLLSLVYNELDTFFDYASKKALYVLVEPQDLKAASNEAWETILKNYVGARNEASFCVEPDALYLTWLKVKNIFMRHKALTTNMLSLSSSSFDKKQSVSQYNFTVKDNTGLKSKIDRSIEKENFFQPLARWIEDKKHTGYTTILVCKSKSRVNRMESLLEPYGIKLRFADGFIDPKRGKGIVYVCSGLISSGFVWPFESLAIITENEIFGVKRRRRKKTGQKVQTQILAFADVKKKDLVVHVEHGIGRYEGLVKLKHGAWTNEFLLIIYKDDDKLYLPVDRMSMLSKYMGVEGIEPILDKIGGKSWEKVKQKIEKSVAKIAGKLLKLYAERKIKKGYVFKNTDSDLRDFEAGFPFEETKEQLDAIEDVLTDMEQSRPMDRLVCGDVGYGKTEVALRASFVAVNDGKQVALLVPTTVLAEQHFATFLDRFKHYPVNIAALSRFRSAKKQQEIIADLKNGKIDIIIGTHRLLQKDVGFKDLGLIVLDEEQRFGVRHKEKLKNIRSTVDVLALTATPIPRTLHMSMVGVRDISIISTPPEYRRPIVTYILEFDYAVIKEAVRKELKRGGQIFFVHNNIHSIWAIAKKLQELVPEVKLDIAHGRLGKNELEKVMFSFFNKETDMLVCTTIIESGLDIPSANTIIVNRADRFGLSQIYQMRGRVGRSDEQAYAYLFIPNDSILSRDAKKRLKVLMEHSDLGSGFQIAMSDLKIRGGGTILGASQSGHIAAVGYDMFLKLMELSISELKGDSVVEDLEPEINVAVSGYIPETYIPDINQRLFTYRRLAKMMDIKEISDFNNELIDRYGSLPVEASNLLIKIILKVLATKAGVKRLDLTPQRLSLRFSEPHQKNPAGLVDMIISEKDRFEFTPDYVLNIKLSKNNENIPFIQVKNILKEIARHVNG